MRKYTIGLLVVLMASAVGLAACDEPDAATLKTICTALIGPIRYNAENKASLYFAGQKLVFTLKQRNQVWDGLGCTRIVGDSTQIVKSVPKHVKAIKVRVKAHKARAVRAAPVAPPAPTFTVGSWHQNEGNGG
jgi:hypothetical protein